MCIRDRVYAGWQAPSEEAVVKAVMTAAKADFSKLTMVGADGSGFASLGKSVDIQWEFEGWAVTKGRMEGYELNYIPSVSYTHLDVYKRQSGS